MKTNKSSEDYLETILLLKNKIINVRSIDIVNETGYKKPSISIAMKKLRESNYITVDNSGLISLTPSGEALANKIYNKHNSLKEIFISIGVPEDVAEKDACKIEHCISDESFNCLMEHFKLK